MEAMIAAIGEALIDMIPDKTGCAFDDVTAFAPKIGGAPANVCAAFARLGGRARLLTQLGDDPFGHRILHRLEEVGVETAHIALTQTANTALAFVSLAENGDRTFSFYRKPSADMLYAPEQVQAESLEDVFALHFCSVSLGDFPMKEAHRRAIGIQRERGGIVSFDPNLRFNLWDSEEALRDAVREFLPMSDIVKLSDEELTFVTGQPDMKSGAEWLFAQGVKLLLYTCGSKGAFACTPTQTAFAPAYPVKAIDTTGAGDGFTGAFLWALSQTCRTCAALSSLSQETLTSCLTFANRFCAVSVQKHGAIASYPTREEMQAYTF